MSIDEFGRRAGARVEDVEEWVRLGLLCARGDGDFDDRALERARLLQQATARGIGAADIAAASARGTDVLGTFLDHTSPPGPSLGTVEEVAERAGLDPALARRLLAAGSLPPDELFE